MRHAVAALLLAAASVMPAQAAGLKPPAVADAAIKLPSFPPVVSDEPPVSLGRVYVQRDRFASVGVVDLIVLAGLDRQNQGDGGIAALTAAMILRSPVQGGAGPAVPLEDAVRDGGGSIIADVEGQYVRFTLEASNDRLEALTRLFAIAMERPTFDDATFASAKAALAGRIADDRANPGSVATSSFLEAFYRDSNAGAPPLGTRSDLAKATVKATREFFERSYRRGGAGATLVGQATPQVQRMARALVDTLRPGSSTAARIPSRPPLPAQTMVISYRNNVTQPWLAVGYGAPSADSPDFGAMMVLSTMLENEFTRESTTFVSPAERPIGVRYDYRSSPATVVISVNGAIVDGLAAEREILVLLNALEHIKIEKRYVDSLKVTTLGEYAVGSSDVAKRADEVGSLARLGSAPDKVVAAINAVTPEDLQRVIKRYCARPIVSVVLPHGPSDR